MSHVDELIVRHLGQRPYALVWEAMRRFTDTRDQATPDEIWLLEHPPVYTQGQAGRPEHLLDTGAIPVIQIDRGGQVTYHGPGQLVVYTLLDLARRGRGIRHLVTALELTVIDMLAEQGIEAAPRSDAPGVYVDGRKIASLGLRVRRGRCYHGLSLNVDMDLAPFAGINPCGHTSLEMTQLDDLGRHMSVPQAAATLIPHLASRLEAQTRITDTPPEELQDHE